VNPTFHSPPLRYGVVGRPNRPWCKHRTVGDHPQARVMDYLFLRLTTAVNQVRIESRAAPDYLGRSCARPAHQQVMVQ
ncbi:MAG TPA: hypothetical protein VEF72_00565, partial [Mycobacterium sp.]|nr:hypothetical protein [Mycobacterium sp.]